MYKLEVMESDHAFPQGDLWSYLAATIAHEILPPLVTPLISIPPFLCHQALSLGLRTPYRPLPPYSPF